MKKRHIIVYSHGFGVRKDDRGLFTDISRAFPHTEHIMFDYNEVDEANNTLTISSLQEQVRRLNEKLESIGPGVDIDIVAHSQGCMVVGLAKPQNIRRIAMLAPPESLGQKRMMDIFGSRPGAKVDFDGNSTIPRRDGSTTIIPKEYWEGIEVDAVNLYNDLSDLVQVRIFVATDDEILGVTNFESIGSRIDLVQTPGNHDFTDENRQVLVNLLEGYLS